MKWIERIPTKVPILYKEYFCQEQNIEAYLIKCLPPEERHYFRFFIKESDGSRKEIAYIYFNLNFEEKTSSYIGSYVSTEYRNQGFGNLLIATWITFCLENNFDILKTIKKQRKPFLIYLLKKFQFDLENEMIKDRRRIHICQQENSLEKYLYFEDDNQRRGFHNSNVMKEDNYQILTDQEFNSQKTTDLDTIFLLKPYKIKNNNEAMEHALKITKKFS